MVMTTNIVNAKPFSVIQASAAAAGHERLVRENANLKKRVLQAEAYRKAAEAALAKAKNENQAAKDVIDILNAKIRELTDALASASVPKKQKKDKKPADQDATEKPQAQDNDKQFKITVSNAQEDAYKAEKDDGTSL